MEGCFKGGFYLCSLAVAPLFECFPESEGHEACIWSTPESLKCLLYAGRGRKEKLWWIIEIVQSFDH